MKALIIDFTGKHEVKVLNTRITSSVSIISGYYMRLKEGEDPVASTAAKLKRENLADLPAYIIPSREFLKTQTFTFPPMPDRELAKVLPREIASAADSSEPMAFAYYKNGTVLDKGTEKIEVAVFYQEQKHLFQFTDQLKKAGINAVKLIPEVQAFKELVGSNPNLTSERTGVVFLEMMAGRLNLNFFKSSYWGLDREFVFQFDPTDELQDDDLSRISIELNRTFQYFKQRNRMYSIDKMVIFGANPNISHLKNFVSDNLPVEVEVLTPEHFDVKITYPPHLDDTGEFVLIFGVPIAMAAALTKKKVLNLLPEDFKERGKMPRRLLGLTISTAVIVAILAGAVFYFEQVKNSYKKDKERMMGTYTTLGQNVSLMQKTRQERADYYKKRFFTDIPLRYSYGAANFVRRLSIVAAADIQLLKLELNPSAQDIAFILNGSIDADDNINAQGRFLRFYQALKAFHDMAQITFSTIKINAGNVDNTSLPADIVSTKESRKKEDNQVELFFTIKGEVELE